MRTLPICLCVLLLAALAAIAETTLEITGPQTAGISGFRAHWDSPFLLSETGVQKVIDPQIKERGGQAVWANGGGALAFDALNRSLLVRFPDAAEKIAAQVKAGNIVRKVELVLPFRDEELWPVGQVDYNGPDGYNYRMNWDVDKLYRLLRPRWHAVAWALRRPWSADATLGPTFNAAVNGAVYWARFGAADTAKDRFAQRFGPAEVSYKAPEGRLDLTALLLDPAYGATPAARLRQLADCGVLLQKEETYDAMYFGGAYEWATAIGGRAILVQTPKLVVTFAPGKTELGALPAPADIPALAAKGPQGAPTAVMPTAEQLQQLAARYAQKPAWMADWQWQHVQELLAAEHPEKAKEPFWYQYVASYQIDRLVKSHWANGQRIIDKPADPAAVYNLWVDGIIGRQPRGWSGFESAREMAQWNLYKDALPVPAQEAIKRYWTAWLMPDRPTAATETQRRSRAYNDGPLVHPMVDDARVDATVPKDWWLDPLRGNMDTYWVKTGDWRGNKSFFRSGFCYSMSTQNFNTTASAGALLAGAMIGSEAAMADGRHGVETFPLRMYCWSDGSGQEHIDHYYFSVTLAGNKAVADYAQTPFDRLLGQSLLVKNMEELISGYHPGLRGFIAGSSRTSLDLLLGMQDGIYHALHTVSKSGTLRDYGTQKLPGGISTWGHDVPPAQAAMQTLAGPWTPDWVVPMVDDKPLPYEAKHTGWGGVKRTCYLGQHYGLASNAVNPGRIQAMAQWRRAATQAASMRDLTTMDVRYTSNTALWANDGQGSVSQPGVHSFLQGKNKLIALMSPKPTDGKATALQSSIGLFNFQEPAPAWEIYVDGVKVEALPFTCKQGQRITIKDGVTYLGVIPLPATDLGRDAEVTLAVGPPQKAAYYQSNFGAALVINSYNYKGATPLAKEQAAAGKAYSGFVIELGDVAEYGDFAKFQRHMADANLNLTFDDAAKTVAVKYISGKDTLEAASVLNGTANLSTALVNGQSPFLPAGLERDTPYCQQGIAHVAKNGATLDADPKRRIFLLTEPKAGVYCGWNPLPDLTSYTLTVPGGITVTADGKLSLTRVTVRPAQRDVQIDQGFKPGQEAEEGAAQAMLIYAKTAPTVTLNGVKLEKLTTKKVGDKTAWVVPLK